MTSPNTPLDPRPYDLLWEADGRRQSAMRRANRRYPDHSFGTLPAQDPLLFWGTIVALGALALAGAALAVAVLA